MKKSELRIILSKLKGFEDLEKAHPDLEQYTTPPEIAAEVLNLAKVSGDIEGKIVLDLGTGTGIFSIGSALLEAKKVIAVDKDSKAIEAAEKNKKIVEEEIGEELEVKFINEDIINFEERGDTVIMNPPFGIQERDRNLLFLRKGMELSENVYTLLHSSEERTEETRKFIKEYISSFSSEGRILKRFNFGIPKTYKFHEKKNRSIGVDLWVLKTGNEKR